MSDGDIASIYDKTNQHEVLSGPAQLAFLHEKPAQYPAWNMDWNDRRKPPYAVVEGPATVRIVENGPARVALEVERSSQGSRFVQKIRLAGGEAGDHVEIDIDNRLADARVELGSGFSTGSFESDCHL